MSRARRKHKRPAPPAARPRPLRLGLLTCIWQRPALTDLVLGHYAALRDALADDVTLTLLAAGSEGQTSRTLAERHGFRYLEHPNQPLGAKWNAGLRALRDVDLDALLIVGSDDLLDRPLIARYLRALRGGAHFIGLRDMYFFDQPSRRMLYWPGYIGPRAGETTGLGRCIHRALLDAADWRLWEDDLASGLDRSMMSRLAPLLPRDPRRQLTLDARALGFAPVDVKTAVNLWSFDQIAGSGRFEHLDGEALLRAHYPDALVDALLALPTTEAPAPLPSPATSAPSPAAPSPAAPSPAAPSPAAPSPAAPSPATPIGPATEIRIGASGGRVIWAVPPANFAPPPPAPTQDPLLPLLDAGEAAFADGRLDDAHRAFEAVLAHAPTHPRALNDLAVVHHARGDADAAERAFLKAAIFDPRSPDPLVNLAAISRAAGRLTEAAAYIERAFELGGETPELLDEMATLTAASGDRALARDLHARARADAPATGHRAAFVEIDITPDLDARPVPLQGLWSDSPRIATTVAAPLAMQIVLLEDGHGTRALLVAADIFAFDPAMVDRVRAWAAIWGIAPEAVLLNASHTHYGPGTFSGAAPGLGPIDLAHAEALCDTIGAALPLLYQALAPAALAIANAAARIGFNRRRRQGDRIVMAPDPTGDYETETPILVIERADGATCVLVNHGCHPTGLGAAAVVSPDFPGALRDHLRDHLRARLGAHVTPVYLQGAAGDIKHGHLDGATPRWSADLAATRDAGARLGDAVLAALTALTPIDGPIRTARATFAAPLRPRGPLTAALADPANADVAPALLREWADHQTAHHGDTPPPAIPLTVEVLAIGPIALCATATEPVAALARALRERALHHDTLFVLGYTNGITTYLPTDRMIREGGYEAWRAHYVYLLPAALAEGTEPAFLAAADAALAAAAPPLRPPPPTFTPPLRHAAHFVLSTGRSGTRTLAHLLATATNARIWHHPEPKLIEETLLAWHDALDPHATFWRARGPLIRAAWDAGLVHGETDHNMTAFAEAIAADIPDARFIVLVRDPREFVRSGMRRRYYIDGNIWDRGRLRPHPADPDRPRFDALDPFGKTCWLWAETYRRIERLRERIAPDHICVIRFEDLIAGPAETGRLFDFLGLDGFDPARVAAILGQKLNAQTAGDFPHPAHWPPELHARCWAEVGEIAGRYGYAASPPGPRETP